MYLKQTSELFLVESRILWIPLQGGVVQLEGYSVGHFKFFFNSLRGYLQLLVLYLYGLHVFICYTYSLGPLAW